MLHMCYVHEQSYKLKLISEGTHPRSYRLFYIHNHTFRVAYLSLTDETVIEIWTRKVRNVALLWDHSFLKHLNT